MNCTVFHYDWPLEQPLRTATTTMRRRSGWIVRLERGGEIGWGEAAAWPGFATGPDALDRAAREPQTWYRCAAGDADVPPEMAFAWTSAAMALDRSADPLPERSIALAGRLINGRPDPDGVVVIKLKADVDSAATARRVREVHEAWPAVRLRIDANGMWSHEDAVRFWGDVPHEAIDWLEQPLPADDLDGLRRLADAGLPIALDETLLRLTAEDLPTASGWAGWVLKPMFLGRERTLAIGRIAADAAIPVAVTHVCEGTIGRIAAAVVAAEVATAPCGLWSAGLPHLADELPVEAGRLHLPASAAELVRGVRTEQMEPVLELEIA